MAVERTVLQWNLEKNSREDYRVAVLLKWSEERCGFGSGDESQRYRYNVENFPDGVIYLHRPARLNKGCDFVVFCEPQIPRDDGFKHKNPRHKDLIQEFKLISMELKNKAHFLLNALEKVWRCEDMSLILDYIHDGIADKELRTRIERSLKVSKWLFIEQDITDWNTSGRTMLMNAIRTCLSDEM